MATPICDVTVNAEIIGETDDPTEALRVLRDHYMTFAGLYVHHVKLRMVLLARLQEPRRVVAWTPSD